MLFSYHRYTIDIMYKFLKEFGQPAQEEIMEEDEEEEPHRVVPGGMGRGNPWDGLQMPGGIIGQRMPPPHGNIRGEFSYLCQQQTICIINLIELCLALSFTWTRLFLNLDKTVHYF
jgi:hypothetical protein